MADTVFEYPNDSPNRGYIGVTRFWKKGEDWVQITLISEDTKDAEVHTYAMIMVRMAIWRKKNEG